MGKDQNIELQKAKNKQYETVLRNESEEAIQIMPYRDGVGTIRLQPGQALVFKTEFCSLLAPYELIRWTEKNRQITVQANKRSDYPEHLETLELGFPTILIKYTMGTMTMSMSFVKINGDRIRSNLNRDIPTRISIPLNHGWTEFLEVEDKITAEEYLNPNGSGQILRRQKQKFVGTKRRSKQEIEKIQKMASEEKKRVERKRLSQYLQSIES